MAQWNHREKTLAAKLVYYGPAFGGKTTNLESLHRLTDPRGEQRLTSLKTAGDRTLFFDLLPFDLGSILGYDVSIKVYTVPGQVRYDTTRQVVLTGADAVVFVADSTAEREEQTRWSVQNLRMNLRSQGISPGEIPIIYQFNKQDLLEAATPEVVAGWCDIPAADGFPAVANVGEGVLESFVAASKGMLERIVSRADERTRKSIDSEQMSAQIDRAFEPYLARRSEPLAIDPAATEPHSPDPDDGTISFHGEDLLADAIRGSSELAEQVGTLSKRVRRQQGELEALRRLNQALTQGGASFDVEKVVDAALEAAADVLGAGSVALVQRERLQDPIALRCWGRVQEPLVASEEGARLVERMASAAASSAGAVVVENLLEELTSPAALEPANGLRAAACVRLKPQSTRYLMVYASQPDGSFCEDDLRFLHALAAQLSVGLEQIALHTDVATHRDTLETTVAARTVELRQTLTSLREIEGTKERLLNNLSHEMRTPLTAILGAATFLQDYESDAAQRHELTGAIQNSAERLQGHLEQLLQVAEWGHETELECQPTTSQQWVDAAIALVPDAQSQLQLRLTDCTLELDTTRISRALANLIDNAIKFSPDDAKVELDLSTRDRNCRLSVLDRGQGVADQDRDRIFAPFEQGGDPLTEKPEGMGVGLYETACVVKLHGGTLSYEPRRGGGSEFVIELPLAQEKSLSDSVEEATCA